MIDGVLLESPDVKSGGGCWENNVCWFVSYFVEWICTDFTAETEGKQTVKTKTVARGTRRFFFFLTLEITVGLQYPSADLNG